MLFLPHSTLPVFHELEYCLICVEFSLKISQRMLYTVRTKFQFVFKTVNSMRAQTHLTHFDEKMCFLNLNFIHVSNNFTPFLFQNPTKTLVWENMSRMFLGKSNFDIFLTVHFHDFSKFLTCIPSYLS
jgi:hypothetical protein